MFIIIQYAPNTFTSECLAHGKDLCMDCLLERLCGEVNQTKECDLIKKSVLEELVKEQTEETQVKVKEPIIRFAKNAFWPFRTSLLSHF